MSRGFELPPLRNGVDYLQDAVRRLGATPSLTDLKYAVLHLHASVEVLLKYRLICKDWRLILDDSAEDAPEVTEQDYEAGKFRSIGLAKALKRLQELDGITFTTGQKRAAAALERFRNQLQHHGLTSTAEAVEAQAAKHSGSSSTSSTTTSPRTPTSPSTMSGSSRAPCPTSAAPSARLPRWSTSGCSACVPCCNENRPPGARTVGWRR